MDLYKILLFPVVSKSMTSIAFVVLKLEGVKYRPSPRVTGPWNSPGGIELNQAKSCVTIQW